MSKFKHTLLYASLFSSLLANSHALANSMLEEIIVTAQKREQSLKDVPATVSALSEENLKDFGIDSLFEVAALVPGMVFSRAPDDGLALTLRGLGTPARTQSFDQSVALFLDGMFVGKGRMYSAAFFDVERMEVIKGTQSTLLGKNTSLGAISIITRKPGDELSANASVSREFENGGWSLDGGVDIPVSDLLKVRIAGHYVDQDGWVENVLTGEDVPADEETSLRITTAFTPNDVFDATLVYQYSDSERRGNGFQYVDTGNYFPADVLAVMGEMRLDDKKAAICPECPGGESFHDTETDSLSLTMNWGLGELTLTSVTSFAQYDLLFFDDFDFGAAIDEVTYAIFDPGTVVPYSTNFRRVEEYEQFSQELRLTSGVGEAIEYMAGLFYFNSDWQSSEEQYWRTPNFPPPAPGQIFNGPFTNNFDQETETISVFAQITSNFSDSLRGTLGLRYTDEQKDVVFERVQGTPATLWNSVINPPFDSPLEFNDSFVNGNINLQYDVTDTAMLYASYGLGSKTGGFAESAEVNSANPALSVGENGARVATEEAQTFEFGAKLTLLDGSANLNVALFRTNIDNFQETSFLVTGDQALFLTRNVDVESEGVELDGQWQVSDAFRVLGGVTYADSVNSDDGQKLAQAPEYTGNLGFLYEVSLTDELYFSASGFARYRDEMVSQINETFPSESLTTYDLNLAVADAEDRWRVALIGTNITNEVAADFSGPPAGPVGAMFGAPPGENGIRSEAPSALRTIRLQLDYSF